jgi:hypothetical protein
MNEKQARKLKVSDRVVFESDKVEGTVIEKGYAAAKIQWDDGQLGIIDNRDFNGIARI